MESPDVGATVSDSVTLVHRDDPRFWRGVAYFDAGAYFAAHEVWEELWMESTGDEKRFLAALIQVAAGYLKRERGVANGARRLWSRALAALDDVGFEAAVDVPRLRDRLLADLAALDGGPGDANPPCLFLRTRGTHA